MNTEIYAERREKLKILLKQNGLDALLVSSPANRFYLSGFELHDGQCNESSGHLLITTGEKDYLCTDSRFYDVATSLWEKENIFIYSGGAVESMRLFFMDIMGTKNIGIESAIVSHNFFENLSQGLSLECSEDLVESLRLIKDAHEIEKIAQSVKLNQQMFDWLPSQLTVGKSEFEIAFAIESFFRTKGASENSFPPIVAINSHAARPHHNPEKTSLIEENCHILIDAGARLEDYCSDQTRTFWVGDSINPRFQNILEQVQQAQQEAIMAVRPGISCKELYDIAYASFERKGVEKFFTHSLGHGVGIEVHEAPSLSPRSNKKLEAGMVITIEPGLYYSDFGGVRWEHMLLVTEDGYRVF